MPSAHLLAPSILAADLSNIQALAADLQDSEADYIHIDVMDGVFVPNFTFAMPVVEAFKKHCQKTLDVHLMMVHPERYLEAFARAGADIITVHVEACPHLHSVLGQIRKLGCKAGVAINPHTPVSVLEDVASITDIICIMSVNPGFGGQSFIEGSLKKISQAAALKAINPQLLVEVDGGVDMTNISKIAHAGADVIVAGNALFKQPDIKEALLRMRRAIQ